MLCWAKRQPVHIIENNMNLANWPQRLMRHFKSSPLLTICYVGLGLLALAPVIVILVDVIVYSVNTPWWDQLSFVTLMQKLHTGQLSIHDLWIQHNEHRILVPQAFELLVGKATGFNFRVPVFLNWVTMAASFGLLIDALRRNFTNKVALGSLIVVFAWLLFSPIQYVNWIWGFQLAFYMSVFFTILTLWLLSYKNVLESKWLLALVIVLASITTYCNGNGLLIWPLGLGLLLWRRASGRRLLWWCGAAVVMIGSYLYKFHRSPGSPNFSQLIREPVAVIKYTLGYLGRNLSLEPTPAHYISFVMIIVLILSCFYLYKKRALSSVAIWITLVVYVILTGLLAAISRLNFGVNHGFDSNSYPTISVLFIVATIAIVAYAFCIWLKHFNKKQLPAYLVSAFALGAMFFYPLPAFITNYSMGQINFRLLSTHLKQVQSCVYNDKSPENSCLLIVYPSKQVAWQTIQELRQLRWGPFKNG